MNPAVLHALPFFATGALLVGALALGFVSRRRTEVYAEYMVVIVAAATHTIAYGLEIATPTLEGKLFLHRIVWLGLATAPPASLLLAFRFVRRPVGKLTLVGLVASAVAVALLA